MVYPRVCLLLLLLHHHPLPLLPTPPTKNSHHHSSNPISLKSNSSTSKSPLPARSKAEKRYIHHREYTEIFVAHTISCQGTLVPTWHSSSALHRRLNTPENAMIPLSIRTTANQYSTHASNPSITYHITQGGPEYCTAAHAIPKAS